MVLGARVAEASDEPGSVLHLGRLVGVGHRGGDSARAREAAAREAAGGGGGRGEEGGGERHGKGITKYLLCAR